MILVKVLERKLVIQTFGLGFFLAPLINTLLSMSLQQVEQKWTMAQFSKIIAAQGFANNSLSVCSIILGLTMLTGTKKSWRFALVLLGIHILVGLPKLGQDIRTSWIYGAGFILNVATFLFIGDQLVFKLPAAKRKEPSIFVDPELAPKPEPIPVLPAQIATPSQAVSRQKILVSFNGGKPWAQISKIDGEGIELKQLGERPKNLEDKQVEIQLGAHITLKMKFSGELGNHIYFKYSNTTDFELRQLNNWLQQQVS